MATDFQGKDDDPSGGEPDSNSYLKRAVRGSTWNLGQSIAAKITGLVTQIILARLLFPSDFGLLGIAVSLIAIVGFINPLSMGDLLVQRGPRFANAVTNVRRLALFGAISASILVIALSPWLSTRPEQAIRINDAEQLTSASPIGSIDSKPPLDELFEQTASSITIHVDGADTLEVTLPDLPSESTIAEYGEALQGAIDREAQERGLRTIVPGDLVVRFDEAAGHLTIGSGEPRPIAITTDSTTAGSILDSFGMSYLSTPLMIMLSLLTLRLIFEAIGVPYRAWMRKEMMFGSLAIMIFSTSLIGQIMAIVIAAMTGSPIALLMTILIPPILQAIVAYFLVRPLPVCSHREREPMKRITSDSFLLWSAQWVHSVGLQAPIVIMGLFLSTSEVGFYVWASTQASQFVQIMYGLTTGVLTPIFSTLQNEPRRLAAAFLRTTRISAGVGVPLFYSIAAIVPIMVPVVFGERWNFSIPILLVLLVERSFSSGVLISGSLLKGSGRYKEWLIWQATYSIMNLSLAAVIGSQFGALSFAVATCVLGSISNIVGFKICLRSDVGFPRLLGIYVLPVLGSMPLMGVAMASFWLDKTWFNMVLTAPGLILVSLGIYLTIIRLGDKDLYMELRKILGTVTPARFLKH